MTRRTSLLFAGLLFVVLAFPLLTGVTWWASVVLTFMVALQWWAGTWLWCRMRPGCSDWECLGAGLALGTSLSTFSGLLLAAAFGVPWGWVAVPGVALAAAIALRRRGRAAPSASDLSRAAWSGVGVGLITGLGGLVWAVRSYPLGTGDWSRYHPDMGFFEALGNSLASFGPLASIFTPDSLIRYHWLVYAWSGQLQVSSGAEPFTVLTRFLPVLALIGAVLVAVAWTRSMTNNRWAPSLATGLLVVGGFVGASYGTVLNFDSPSVAFTAMSLMVVLWMAGSMVQTQRERRSSSLGLLLVLGVLAAMVSGGKVSSAAVAVGSVGIVWLASLRVNSLNTRAATQALAVVLFGSVVAFVAVAAGSADPGGLRIGDLLDRSSSVQGMNPFPGSWGIIAGTALLALSALFRGAGVLWLLASRVERSSPWPWIGLGLLITSVSPILLISGGFNEVWFAVAAAAPLSVISAAGVAKAMEAQRLRGGVYSAIVLLGGVAATSAGVIVAWSAGPSGGNVWVSSLRWTAPLVGVVGVALTAVVLTWMNRGSASLAKTWFAWAVTAAVLIALSGRVLTFFGPLGVQPGMRSDMFTPSTSFVETTDTAPPITEGSDLLAAAAWLQQESSATDLVATNITLWPTVPAVTNRQTLASGLRYQAPYGPASAVPALVERERESWSFISTPSAETARALCEFPIGWLFIDLSRMEHRGWEPWASEAFSSGQITVLRWNSSECP